MQPRELIPDSIFRGCLDWIITQVWTSRELSLNFWSQMASKSLITAMLCLRGHLQLRIQQLWRAPAVTRLINNINFLLLLINRSCYISEGVEVVQTAICFVVRIQKHSAFLLILWLKPVSWGVFYFNIHTEIHCFCSFIDKKPFLHFIVFNHQEHIFSRLKTYSASYSVWLGKTQFLPDCSDKLNEVPSHSPSLI